MGAFLSVGGVDASTCLYARAHAIASPLSSSLSQYNSPPPKTAVAVLLTMLHLGIQVSLHPFIPRLTLSKR